MEEASRYVVGLDIGTENVRAVVTAVSDDGSLSVVGYNEGKSAGMRKGIPANLTGPAESIDKMLGDVERMCGQNIRSAFVSVNGAQIISVMVEGMIIVGGADHEINDNDLKRVEDAAVMGRIPANQEILQVVPLEYTIDGQGGIKDPYGMTGARLELKACVVLALTPNCENLRKATAMVNVETLRLVPSVIAAAKAVLTEKQKENGVAVIDFGATTTAVAVYEEGDLQYVGVVPMGSNNVTNDLAIILAVSTEMAEEVKERFVTGDFETEKSATFRVGKDEKIFERKVVDAAARERLQEIFEEVRKKLKAAKYDQRLPEGVVITGGGAKMRDIEKIARMVLGTAVQVGIPYGLNGAMEDVKKPEYATAVGLAMLAADEMGQSLEKRNSKRKNKNKKEKGDNFLKKILAKF